MKKKLLFLALIPLFFAMLSCKNKFDFDRLYGVDVSGEWGIPLVNAEYSVNDLAKQLDEEGYISQTGNGNLFFSYESSETLIAEASEFMTLSGFEENMSYTIPNLFFIEEPVHFEVSETISLENEYAMLKRGEIESGSLKLNISHDLNTSNVTLTVTMPEFRTPTNEIFQFSVSINALEQNFIEIIDLNELTFMPMENNSMNLTLRFQFIQTSQSPQENFNLDINYKLEEISLKSFYGQVANYSAPFSTSFDFNLFSNNYGGDLTIYNPNLYMATKNSFFVNGQLQIDTASFYGTNGETSLLATTPEIISIPVSPLNFQKEEIDNLDAIRISTDYKSVKVAGSATFNPGGTSGGDIYIGKNSKIIGKFGLTVPFSFAMDQVYYNDTIEFSLDSLLTPDLVEEIVEEAVFRFAVTNGLPLNMNMQAYFYDSRSQQLVDSMFQNSFFLPGTINGATPVEKIAMPVITFNRIHNLTQSDHIILRFKVNTDGYQVDLNVKDHLKVKLGAKLKYDTSGVDLFSNKED